MASRFERAHDRHDVEAVAAHAAGEADLAQNAEARRLLESCIDCVQLSRDLRALTIALQSMPRAEQLAATTRAPRDFRLAPETAARLRPASAGRRLTTRISLAFAALGRPVGASLATLGIVGLLVGSTTLGSLGFSAAGGAQVAAPTMRAAPEAAGSSYPTAIGGASPTTGRTSYGPLESTSADTSSPPKDARDDRALGGPSAWLIAGSGGLVVLGTGLFAVGWLARRRSRSAA